jgi:uncharacterized protein YcbK (DUF882 family)
MLSKYISEQEALWLPSWSRLATEKDGLNDKIRGNIVRTAKILDKIRTLFDSPLIVSSFYRPIVYNKEIGGAPLSYHREGLACDFNIQGKSADEVRAALKPYLTKFKIRMEDLPGSSWVHIDLGMPRSEQGRFFKP